MNKVIQKKFQLNVYTRLPFEKNRNRGEKKKGGNSSTFLSRLGDIEIQKLLGRAKVVKCENCYSKGGVKPFCYVFRGRGAAESWVWTKADSVGKELDGQPREGRSGKSSFSRLRGFLKVIIGQGIRQRVGCNVEGRLLNGDGGLDQK